MSKWGKGSSSQGGRSGSHGDKKSQPKIQRDRLHDKSREMATKKPDGASAEEAKRQDIEQWRKDR